MKQLTAASLAVSLLSVIGLTQTKELIPAQAELVSTERAFAKLSVERGVRASFITYFADDGIGFNPHPYKVKEGLSNRPAPPTRPPVVLNWAPIFGDIAGSGDMGWNTGPTLFEDTSAEKHPAQHGMFFSVWKKQADGSWRVVLDLGISTPSAAAPLDAPFRSARQPGKTATVAPRIVGQRPESVNVEQETAGLLKAEREFLAAAKTSSVGRAYTNSLSEDARVYRPDTMPLVGKSSLRAWLAQQTMALSGEPIKAEVARSGDLGYAYGSYELIGANPERGYYARVWRRDPQGRWRIVMDVISPVPLG